MPSEAPAYDLPIRGSGTPRGPSGGWSLLGRAVLVALWLGGLAYALGMLWQYKTAPGTSESTPANWPQGTHMGPKPGKPTLVLFAHPRCPCTRASLTELREVLSRFGARVTSHVAFLQPHGTTKDWSMTDSWKDASSIPGVDVRSDIDGREANRFGVTTSGHVVLYSAQGGLLYSGGITSARGHVGDSPQLQELTRALESETRASGASGDVSRTSAPVFGCPLEDEQHGTR